MSLPKSTLPKALGLSILVVSTALIGSQLFDMGNDPWPDDLPVVDIYEWANNDTMSSSHLYVYIEQSGYGWEQTIMSSNLSRLALFYNVSNTGGWHLNTRYIHAYNGSGNMSTVYRNYKPTHDNISGIMDMLKPTIQGLNYTEKIVVDHEQDSRGIDTINLFIQEKSGVEYSTASRIEITIVTEDSIAIDIRIYEFGIIMTASWMYYQTEEKSDVKLADQNLVDFLYLDETVSSQEYGASVGMIPPDYYYFVEMPSFESGMQIEYIQAWNELINALQD